MTRVAAAIALVIALGASPPAAAGVPGERAAASIGRPLGNAGPRAQDAGPDTTSASPSPSPAGVGDALRTPAGVIVLVLLAAGFLWLRSRTSRR